MDATQFIKEHGVERAREELKRLPNSNVTHMTDDARMFIDENSPLLDKFQRSQIKDLICIDDLKCLVESVDLIDSLGGLELSKKESNNCRFYEYADMSHRAYAIKQAIADYEAIGGEHV